jgi:membrane protease YdiL (CAAX protease family)
MVPDGKEDDIIIKIFVTIVYSLIVIGGGMMLFKLVYRRNLQQMGLIRKGWFFNFFHGLGFGAASIGLVFVGLLLSGQMTIISVDVDKLLSVALLIHFFFFFLFAFSEELIARGYIMTALKTTRNKWVVFFFFFFLFSLAHLVNLGISILSLIITFLAGLLFAYMFIKSGKLWLPTGFHIAWNFFSGRIFGMRVSGNEQIGVFSIEQGANDFLYGGSYGSEGGFLVTVVLCLGLLYTYYMIKTPAYPVWTIDGDLPLVQKKK